MKHSKESLKRRDKLVALCRSLPEVVAEGDPHIPITVRGKTFAYYQFDHHGDGMIALVCKAPPGEQARQVESDPIAYFVPGYLGTRGWVGVRLDLKRVDWAQVEALIVTACRLTAPKKLAALNHHN